VLIFDGKEVMKILKTNEFTKIAIKGMKFKVAYHAFTNFPFKPDEIVEYIETIDCGPGFCSKRKRGECKGHGMFLRQDESIEEMCMSWNNEFINDRRNKAYLGYTYLELWDGQFTFIKEDEFRI
jgi:predicted RNA binding protein YcfA (HicA-like mRNA interferase family)